MIKIFSQGIRDIPHLSAFLEEELSRWQKSEPEAVLGWGHKKTAEKARRYGASHGLPYIAAEDGFLRSVGLGVEGCAPISLTVDPVGVYYDASSPSLIEELLTKETEWLTEDVLDRAGRAIETIVAKDLSKYNFAPSKPAGWLRASLGLPEGAFCVLLIDQTRGDASVRLGGANETSFERMYADARARHPEAAIVIKTHPDVIAGKKEGYLTAFSKDEKGVYLLTEETSPLSLIREVDEVCAVTSQMGFEALFLQKSVHLYGIPFYAGWGLTTDHAVPPARRTSRSLRAVFAAAYLKLSRYVNPVTGKRITLEEALSILSTQRLVTLANRGNFIAAGFRYWKKPHVRAFVSGPGNRLRFVWDADRALEEAKATNARLLLWSGKLTDEYRRKAEAAGVLLIAMEDGFIRSVGLGSDFNLPYSLVLDEKGIYYDPARPSSLEAILARLPAHPDHDALVGRAKALRSFLIEHQVTKYNVGAAGAELERIPSKDQADVILVPGQVDGDASVKRGGGRIQSNLALLTAVRQRHPDAFIVYKPHPDVESGNRPGLIPSERLAALADLVLSETKITDIFPLVSSIHTLTSLSGFEGLLRGIPVTVYGKPFYAGWGLTTDEEKIERRKAKLTPDELIAGTLILYPRYWDWETMNFCRPEDVCYRLINGQQKDPGLWIKFCRVIRKIRNLEL